MINWRTTNEKPNNITEIITVTKCGRINCRVSYDGTFLPEELKWTYTFELIIDSGV